MLRWLLGRPQGHGRPPRSPGTRSTPHPVDRAPRRTTGGSTTAILSAPSRRSARTAAAQVATTGLPELRLCSRSTRSFSASAPVTYDELVKPIPMTATGAAASNETASSMCGGFTNAATDASGIVGSMAPPVAIAPNGTRAACTPTVSGAMALISDSGPTSACGVSTPIRVRTSQPSGCHIAPPCRKAPGSAKEASPMTAPRSPLRHLTSPDRSADGFPNPGNECGGTDQQGRLGRAERARPGGHARSVRPRRPLRSGRVSPRRSVRAGTARTRHRSRRRSAAR